MESGYRLRLYLLTALILAGFGALLTRLHEFQINRRSEFLNQVPGNRKVVIREPGIRGEITDRNGITLARNLRQYEVSLNLDEIRSAYLAQHEAPKVRRLSKQNGMDRIKTENDIVSIVKNDVNSPVNHLKKLGLSKEISANDLRSHFVSHGGLIPYSYRSDLTYEEFARIAEHNLSLPGVNVGVSPQRQYPYGALASHILGYLKQWEKGDIPESAARIYNHYVGDDKGVAGVEAYEDEILRGQEGKKVIINDEKGRLLRVDDYTKPGVGAQLQLTIDAPVQYLVENTLRRVGRAAAVVMDVNTGEVLAMASVPDYDPNAFIPAITTERFKAYNEHPQLSPLTNRAISEFAPGSTMKIPTAIAGALQGMASRSFSCDGYIAFGNHKVGCWIYNKSHGSHGLLTLPKAIQQSCNPYFNKLALAVGWKNLVQGCQLVGIGKKTNIELPNEKPGILPGSRAWFAAHPNASMSPVLTAFTSIGQGDSMATPLQMCAVAASIANGGKYYQPRIIRKAVSQDGVEMIKDQPKLLVDLVEAGIKPNDFELIRKGMWMAVNVPGGTAGAVKMPNVEIAGKTGTAQTIDNGKKSNNSWVISFAPFQNPKYAICILVQNGGSGGHVCGPLAHIIYQGLFARDAGEKLPLRAQKECVGNTNRFESLSIPANLQEVIFGKPEDQPPAPIEAPKTSPDDASEESGGEIEATPESEDHH